MTTIPTCDVELLTELTDLIAPPGFEDEVNDWLLPRITPLVHTIERDPLGNVLVWLAAKDDPRPRVMIDCHTDEVGFLVSHVDDKGFIEIRPLGGWDQRVVPASLITIATRKGRVTGSIGTPPPHITKGGERSVIEIEDLRVDVGARTCAEAAELGIKVGDPAAIHYPTQALGAPSGEPEVLVGKAFDNRCGTAALVRLLERFKANPVPDVAVCASFSVAEEVGLRGARTAAYTLDPAFALALEGTVAADVPGVAEGKCPSKQGGGAAISIADRTLVVPRRLVETAFEIAEQHGIPHQFKRPTSGGTDAGAIHLSRGGVPSMVISSPCRYIHSAVSTVRLEDWRAQVDLAEQVVRAAGSRILG